jgi:hypothetical protein
MRIQKPKKSSDSLSAVLYDLDRPEGQQVCCIGPVDVVADILLGLQEKPEVSLTCEMPN